TAVLRQHVENSYGLIAPTLKEGMSRDEWAKGENPIIPYPVDLKTVQYRVDYSYAASPPDGLPLVGMTVSMKPQKGIDERAMDFGIELEAVLERELVRAVREQETLRAGGGERLEGLVGRQVPARVPVQLAALEGRLAHEEVDVLGQLDQTLAGSRVSRVRQGVAAVRHAQPVGAQGVVGEAERDHLQ